MSFSSLWLRNKNRNLDTKNDPEGFGIDNQIGIVILMPRKDNETKEAYSGEIVFMRVYQKTLKHKLNV